MWRARLKGNLFAPAVALLIVCFSVPSVRAGAAVKMNTVMLTPNSVREGDTVVYEVKYEEAELVTLTEKDIILMGFTADISVSEKENKRIITLNHVTGVGNDRYIRIKGNTAFDAEKSPAENITATPHFSIKPQLFYVIIMYIISGIIIASLIFAVYYTYRKINASKSIYID